MTISIDDRHIVESYQAGDTHAFADLVEAYTPALLGHAIRRLGDRAAAEDAVQETFVRAYRALARFDGDYRVGPWLHRILINVCNDEGNRRRREAEKFDRFAADPFAADLAPGVEDELGLDVDDLNLASALQSLPPNYREALNLRFVQELPYDEVARVAGVSEQNARARVSRARSAARAALRGVAAIPMLLIPALRRTESVAAAAQGEAARTGAAAGQVAPAMGHAADVAIAAAPAVTPFLAKAVVGVTLVAAVASPTVGTELVDRGRAVGAADVAVVDSQPEGAAPVEATAGAEVVVPPVSSEVAPRGAGAAEVSSPADVLSGSGAEVGGPVALPAVPAKGQGPGDGASPTLPTIPGPVVVADSTLTISGLQLTAVGPQVVASGAATLAVDGHTVTGPVAGTLDVVVDEATGGRTYRGLLIISTGDGRAVDVRVDLRAVPVTAVPPAGTDGDAAVAGVAAGGADEPTVPAEPTRFDLVGTFRAAVPASVPLADSGVSTGVLDLASATLRLTLAA